MPIHSLQFSPSQDLLERLAHASNQQLGLALEMTWQAIARAAERSSDPGEQPGTLELQDFAHVYHRRTASGFGLNVFDAADWRQIDTTETIPKLVSDVVERPRRRKAPR